MIQHLSEGLLSRQQCVDSTAELPIYDKAVLHRAVLIRVFKKGGSTKCVNKERDLHHSSPSLLATWFLELW